MKSLKALKGVKTRHSVWNRQGGAALALPSGEEIRNKMWSVDPTPILFLPSTL